MQITSSSQIDEAKARVLHAAKVAQDAISRNTSDPLSWLKDLKFGQSGIHPLAHHQLNFMEQVNQTFTYLVALEATRVLLTLHPTAGGFTIAPGAHASQPLDIMSVKPGLVGAECFAAVHPRNNQKMKKYLAKLHLASETYRYVFFSSPLYPNTEHLAALDRGSVEVWSVSA